MPSPDFASSYSIPHPHRLRQDCTKDNIGHISQFARSVRGSIRPCGKGTIGYVPPKKVSKQEAEYDTRVLDTIAIEYQDVDPSTGELLDSCTRVNQSEANSLYPLPCQESQPVAVNPRIADNLTTRGKKYLEDGCFLLERKYGIKGLGFYTLTLSLDNESDIMAFNAEAATILKRFLEKVKRAYERQNTAWLYVGVWEIHPGRSRNVGYPCLHFHYVAPCYKDGGQQFVLTSSEIRDIWTSTVATGLGIELSRKCRVGSEVCRKNSAGYLAKYYSKGNSRTVDETPGYVPCPLSSWYSVCRNLLHLIRRCTIPVGQFVGCDNQCPCIQSFLDDYTSSRGEVVKNIDGRDVVLGYWFVLDTYFHGCILVQIDSILF